MSTNKDHFWKYNEGEILKQLEEYLIGTYNAHYVGENGIQAVDLISAMGDGIPFSRASIIKYASRYGKKNGLSKSDCLKILHFGIFLYHFSNHDTPTTEKYETIS
jgi:hypothetical protein